MKLKNANYRPMFVIASLLVATLAMTTKGAEGSRHPSNYRETIIHVFQGNDSGAAGGDGWGPSGPLVADQSGALYGTTVLGGGTGCDGDGCGTVYTLTPAGSGYSERVLYRFSSPLDGVYPHGLAIDSEGVLYGVTTGGTCPGSVKGSGTVFSLSPAGSSYVKRVLWTFGCTSGDGIDPARISLGPNGAIYGVTSLGGRYGKCGFSNKEACGTAFALIPSGSTYVERILWNFGRDRDGAEPLGLLAGRGGTFYGTTFIGGRRNGGTVFKLTPAGSSYTEALIHQFGDWRTQGGTPKAGLVADRSGNLYGTASWGGRHRRGTVFKLTPTATGYRATTVMFEPKGPQSPDATLVPGPSGMLYGVSSNGGKTAQGTAFSVDTNTSRPALSLLHQFYGHFGSSDGRDPQGEVYVDSAGVIYGTTWTGGGRGCFENGCGVVFKLTPE